MELHLPPIIAISVAAAAAILEDVDDEAPPPSRQGQESLEWQERTPTYLAGVGEADHLRRVPRSGLSRRARLSAPFPRLVRALLEARRGDHQPTATKIRLFLTGRDQLKTTISNSLAWPMEYDTWSGG